MSPLLEKPEWYLESTQTSFILAKSSIVDIQLGSKYASASSLLDNFAKFLGKHPSDRVFLKPTAVPENGCNMAVFLYTFIAPIVYLFISN